MPRLARKVAIRMPYHIIQRGNLPTKGVCGKKEKPSLGCDIFEIAIKRKPDPDTI